MEQVEAVAATLAASLRSIAPPGMDEVVDMNNQYLESSGIHENGNDEEVGHITEKVRLCLERLGEAAVLACKVETAIGTEDRAKCIDEFLEDFDDLLDPEGVAERLRENRLVEDGHRDLSLHVAGHLFT